MTTGRHFDLMDAKAFNDGIPYDYFRELRQRDGIPYAHDSAGRGSWYLVRHSEVVAASRDTTVFSSAPSTMTSVRQESVESAGPPIIAFLDGPAHYRLRRLTARGFAPARLAGLEQTIRRIVDRLLAEMSSAESFDLAEDVALQLPLEVLAELIGVPRAERGDLLTWSRQTVNIGDDEYDKNSSRTRSAFQNIFDYLLALARRRQTDPSDDLLSMLLSARLQNDQLSPIEIARFAMTLMNVGSDTTYCAITCGVLALLEHPDQLTLLRGNRELIPSAIEEILRWVTPVTHFARNVTQDVEISGQLVKAGERVVMWYTSANRDETVFDDPERFDITRTPNPHIAFGGGGPHVCIGNHLAMLELRCFLESWLDRLGELELTSKPTRTETNFMNGYRWMPAKFR